MVAKLYLEDFAVGQRFESGSHEMTAEAIKRFATEFDPQPFHLDETAARDSLFGSLAASGWHTASVTMRLLVEGGAPIAGGVIGGGGDITWPLATRPGDVLQVTSEIVEIKPSRTKPHRGMVTVRSETKNQRGETVQIMVSRLVVPRRPEGVSGPAV